MNDALELLAGTGPPHWGRDSKQRATNYISAKGVKAGPLST